MKTTKHIFNRLCDPSHLERAADLTVRRKRRRADVAWFLFRRETVLDVLERQLQEETWWPQGFRVHRIHDPKPRAIAVAPIEDRVVHTALVKLMEPVFFPSLTDDAFACRPGFGTHRALIRLLDYGRRYPWCLHLDIRSYFPSIDLDILRDLLARKIRDDRFLEMVNRVLVSGSGVYDRVEIRRHARIDTDWPPKGRGLPIGAYTSQLFAAHVYLCDFDHFVKRLLKVPGYLRYVDDLFLFAPTRAELRSWRTRVGEFLEHERHLRLKVPGARILSCSGHLDALGHRLTRKGIEPLPRSFNRLRSRVARACCARRRAHSRPEFRISAASTISNILFG